jgi:lysophospholipase L1-like esterase
MTTRGVPGTGQPVTYPPATVTGGASPVTTTCTPASGTSFNVGTTAVSCTAVDAASRQAQCSFTVTLTPMLVSVTKYMAFGDSLTEGENGRFAVLGLGFIDPAATYPVKLESRLNSEYPGQSSSVVNRGKSGEHIEEALTRLPAELSQYRPGGLLLLDGYNNLLDECKVGFSGSGRCTQKISDVVFGIRDMIRTAKRPEYGISYVFVSTLTPSGPYLGVGNDRRLATDAIVRTNSGIMSMARSEGATLVDTYPTFLGHEADYVDQDGLHLRPAGYQALADSFFNGIKNTVTSVPGLGMRSH